jgi:hypothetical protein
MTRDEILSLASGETMTRDEILSLTPGKHADDAIAVAMGWQPARARWINYWRDGKRIIRQWRP